MLPMQLLPHSTMPLQASPLITNIQPLYHNIFQQFSPQQASDITDAFGTLTITSNSVPLPPLVPSLNSNIASHHLNIYKGSGGFDAFGDYFWLRGK